MGSAGKWHQVKVYLEAAGLTDDPASLLCANMMLSRWVHGFNRTFTQAKRADAEAALELLAAARAHLSVNLAKELEFIFRTAPR